MRSLRSRVVFALLLAGLSQAGIAAAQEDVRAILQRGVELRASGRDADALEEFHRAYGLLRSPVAAGQLGLCEQALGRWIDAERHLREALAAPDDDWVLRNRDVLETAYTANAQRVGRVELVGGVAGAEVRVDGERVGTLPLTEALRVLVGSITLEVHAEGHYDLSRRVAVGVGVTREEIDLRPRPTAVREAPPVVTPVTRPVVPATPRPGSSRSSLRIAGWVGLGLGVSAGVTSLVAVGVREDAARTFNGTCPANPSERSMTCTDLTERGDAMTVLAVVSASVGGALLIASGVVLLLPTRSARRVGWACVPALDGRGASCAWAF